MLVFLFQQKNCINEFWHLGQIVTDRVTLPKSTRFHVLTMASILSYLEVSSQPHIKISQALYLKKITNIRRHPVQITVIHKLFSTALLQRYYNDSECFCLLFFFPVNWLMSFLPALLEWQMWDTDFPFHQMESLEATPGDHTRPRCKAPSVALLFAALSPSVGQQTHNMLSWC